MWDIKKTQYKVSDFLSWQRARTLNLSPNFQRRSVWKQKAKSYLIDTIVRGLPIPIIFVRERQTDLDKLEPEREVVDGQQRLRTVLAFIRKESLKDYDETKDTFYILKSHNPEVAGLAFEKLPEDSKRRILDYEFSVHVLPVDISDREVLNIFARMNSTGVKLNAQELRNAEFFGEFKSSVYDRALAHLQIWRELRIFSEDQIARMEEAEFCSELYQAMLEGMASKSKRKLDAIYEEYEDEFPTRKEIEKRLDQIMGSIADTFSEEVRITRFHNKQFFFLLFMTLYRAMYGKTVLTVSKQGKKLTSIETSQIKKAIGRIEAEKVPIEVLKACNTRRISNQKERNIVIDYLLGV